MMEDGRRPVWWDNLKERKWWMRLLCKLGGNHKTRHWDYDLGRWRCPCGLHLSVWCNQRMPKQPQPQKSDAESGDKDNTCKCK